MQMEKDLVVGFQKNINNLLDGVFRINTKSNIEDMEINRLMVRQLIERPEIKKSLESNKMNRPFLIFKGIMYSAVTALIFLLVFKRPFFMLFSFVLSSILFYMDCLFSSSRYPEKFYNKVFKIAGSEEHMAILEEMICNTPYSLKAVDKSDKSWVYAQLINFKEKDKNFLINQNLSENSSALKSDLLRNINKD